jgi:transposase InsO family protein
MMLRRFVGICTSTDELVAALEAENLSLMHQNKILRRQVKRPIYRMSDRAFLVAVSRILPRDRWNAFLVRPETVMGWHRMFVARKYTRSHRPPGRPALDPKIQAMILGMAKDNASWGYPRISGELQKLGIRVSATAIAMLLRRHGIGPAPRRGPTWRQFLKAQATSIIACDFFTVESAFLKSYYVLFFIELGSRRVHVSVSTTNPDGAWVTQQARNLMMAFADEGKDMKFLIRDRDTKFSRAFDEVFLTEGIRIIRTPIRAPNANAYAERWVETVRAECLDWLLILGPRHLDRVLRIYVDHYNARRPHRGIELRAPEMDAPPAPVTSIPEIQRHVILGGLINEYSKAA